MLYRSNNTTIVEAGAIPPLVALLTDGTDEAKEYASGAIRNLSNGTNKTAIVEAGANPPLVALLASGTDEAKGNAAAALLNLCAVNNGTARA